MPILKRLDQKVLLGCRAIIVAHQQDALGTSQQVDASRQRIEAT